MNPLFDRVLIQETPNRVRPCPELAQVTEFQKLWSRDRGSKGDNQGRKKLRAQREFAYIFHMYSYKSPYASIREEDRHNVIVTDIFPEDKWEPDDIVSAAALKYRQLIETPTLAVVRNGLEMLNTLSYSWRNMVIDGVGVAPKAMKEITSAMKDIGPLIKSLKSLEEELSKEQEGKSNIRRGVEPNEFNT